MTAYWVVYINEDLEIELRATNINDYKYQSLANVNLNHVYASKITGETNMKVNDDNFKLENEITDWKMSNLVKVI